MVKVSFLSVVPGRCRSRAACWWGVLFHRCCRRAGGLPWGVPLGPMLLHLLPRLRPGCMPGCPCLRPLGLGARGRVSGRRSSRCLPLNKPGAVLPGGPEVVRACRWWPGFAGARWRWQRRVGVVWWPSSVSPGPPVRYWPVARRRGRVCRSLPSRRGSMGGGFVRLGRGAGSPWAVRVCGPGLGGGRPIRARCLMSLTHKMLANYAVMAYNYD